MDETEGLKVIPISPHDDEPAGAGECSPEFDGPACDVHRLGGVLEQIAEGLHHLHESGMLHRDLKPSNVLVTPAGRVAILDFGLVAEVPGGPRSERRQSGRPPGPLVSIPPVAGLRPDGSRPRGRDDQVHGPGAGRRSAAHPRGGLVQLRRHAVRGPGRRPAVRRQASPHPVAETQDGSGPPARRRRGIPAELDSLCVKLLRANPTEHPSYAEIMGRCASQCAAPRQPSLAAIAQTEHPFVGRESELSRLHDARDSSTKAGRSLCSCTAVRAAARRLIQRFLANWRMDRDAILSGSCFEQESVPFKAVDSLVDSLSRY